MPRSYQALGFGAWQHGYKRFLDIWHRRGGKTSKWLNLIIQAMFVRIGTYAHIFPELKQAREVVWEGMGANGVRYLDFFPPQYVLSVNKSEMSVTLRHPMSLQQPGSRYVLLGTDRNVNALVGMNAIGMVWDEYSMQNPAARRYARPILAENDGWEAVCFTPRGENHAKELYDAVKDNPEWYCQYLTVDDTKRDAPGENGGPVIRPEHIEQDRAEGVDEATIEQEYWLSWEAPMPGAYYAKEMRLALAQGRIGEVPYDPTRRVHTCWDFGVSTVHDTNAVWFFQLVGQMVHWIDYYQASNEGVQHFVTMLDDKKYAYGTHFAQEKDLDEAEWGEGKTRFEHFKRLGITFTAVPKLSLADGINDVRLVLGRSRFDALKCHDGVNGLRNFRREWDDEKKIFANKPVHDWASHPEAAFRYGSVGILEVDETRWLKSERAAQRAPRAARGADFNPLSRW